MRVYFCITCLLFKFNIPLLKNLYLQFSSYLQLVSKSTGMNKIVYFFFLATIPLFSISFTTDFLNFADALSPGGIIMLLVFPFFSGSGYVDFSVILFVQSCFLGCLGICSFSS